MAGKCRPSLRGKTLANVMYSNLSKTDKDCIKAVFERYEERPKGRWILKKEWRGGRWHKWYECSCCGEKDDNYEMYEAMPFAGGLSNFCPNCGADMRESESE